MIFKRKLGDKVVFVGLISLLVIGQFYFARKYIFFSERDFIYPPHPVFSYLSEHAGIDRFVSLGEGHIRSNVPSQYGLYSPDDPVLSLCAGAHSV